MRSRSPIIEMIVILILMISVSFAGGATAAYFIIKPATPLVNFSADISSGPDTESIYGFMPKEMEGYILSLCQGMKVDPNLVLSILLNENPGLDPTAVNRNTNASVDLGLFQLNSAYVWTSFKKNYWKFGPEVEYDVFNYRVNAYIAISHIKHLVDRLHSFDAVVAAYNCGESAVMKNSLPESTKVYLARAKKNYMLLLSSQNNDNLPEPTGHPVETGKTAVGLAGN